MNTYSLTTQAPISEFIEMLRDWLIAGNADPRAIDKVDELRECADAPIVELQKQVDDLQGECDDIAEELRALYRAVLYHSEYSCDVTSKAKEAARLCIQRHKIT